MKVSLRRGDTLLATMEMKVGCDPVLVGRSHDCALRVPSDEHSVSGRHVRLFWKGSKLYIEDAGSRNGIFHDGRQIVKPRCVGYGDRFAVGNCQISIAAKEKRRKRAARAFHRLEYMNGEKAGRTVDIHPKTEGAAFAIGLDPGCEICLPDMLVSRKHAQLTLKADDECWIEDLGSRNGTFVNGERLGAKERLLKHGDRISVAYFDLRFLDRKMKVTRIHAWVKLAAVAITACAMVAAYMVWTASRLAVDDYMRMAREYASVEDFVSARKTLEMALAARDASKCRPQIDMLSNQVTLWEKTRDEWEQVRKDVADGRFKAARLTIDRLNSLPIESWTWKMTETTEIRKTVSLAAEVIRLYFDGRESIDAAASGGDPGAAAAVRKVSETIETYLRNRAKDISRCEFIQPVVKGIGNLRTELDVIRKGFQVIDDSLAEVSSTEPDFRSVLDMLGKVADNANLPAAVRGYARQQFGVCKAFLQAQEFVERELQMLLDMNFNGVAKLEKQLQLPDPENCLRQAKFSDARAAFISRHEALQQESASLRMIVEGLRESGVTPEGRGDTVDSFVTLGNWKKALSFDCLAKHPPNARRNEPSSSYDEMFGIEFTYESLRAMPNVYNGRGMRMVGFTPKCIVAKKAFERVETFVKYLDGADKKHLQQGALGRFYTLCVKIAIAREEMVAGLKQIKGSKRLNLVVAFYAEYFTARPTFAAKRVIESQFSALRRELTELGDEYAAETDPEKQILIRNKIIATGLPGDPVVHTKWVQMFN